MSRSQADVLTDEMRDAYFDALQSGDFDQEWYARDWFAAGWTRHEHQSKARTATLLRLLRAIYDAYARGEPCYQRDEESGEIDYDEPLGNAFCLDTETEFEIITALRGYEAAQCQSRRARTR